MIMAIRGRNDFVRNSFRLIFNPKPVIDIVKINDVKTATSDIVLFDTGTSFPRT